MDKRFIRTAWSVLGVVALAFFILYLTTEKEVKASNPPLYTSASAATPANRDAKKHKVTITSDPLGAYVYLDGKTYTSHKTPVTLELSEGPHTYLVGYETYQAEYDLYKPYSGKLAVEKSTAIDVWLDRYTPDEVAERDAQEAAAAKSAEDLRIAEAAADNEAVRYNGERISESLAAVLCEGNIKDRLKAPSTAKFPSPWSGNYTTPTLSDNTWTYVVDVDAQNSFGAMIRSTFVCVIDATADTITAEEL